MSYAPVSQVPLWMQMGALVRQYIPAEVHQGLGPGDIDPSGPLSVEIIVGKNEHTSSVKVGGSVVHNITDSELDTFGLRELSRQQPANVTVDFHAPGDPTRVTLRALSAEILGVSSVPVIVKHEDMINRSKVCSSDVSTGISQSLSNTVSTKNTDFGKISTGTKIGFKIGFGTSEVNGETSFAWEHGWSYEDSHSTAVTVGSNSKVALTLPPATGVRAELTSTRGTMSIKITYQAYIEGKVAFTERIYSSFAGASTKRKNFRNREETTLRNVQELTSKRAVEITEIVQIGYYSNGKIELKDLLPDGTVAGENNFM